MDSWVAREAHEANAIVAAYKSQASDVAERFSRTQRRSMRRPAAADSRGRTIRFAVAARVIKRLKRTVYMQGSKT